MPDAATAGALRRILEVARTLPQFGSVTKAVVGIGLWAPKESTVDDATGEDVREALHHRGVRGEITGAIVDSLVTHASLARTLLEDAEDTQQPQ